MYCSKQKSLKTYTSFNFPMERDKENKPMNVNALENKALEVFGGRIIPGNLKNHSSFMIAPQFTFSNSKKMDTSLDVNRDHAALLSGCLALLADDGQIIFSTNAKSFKFDKSLEEICFVKEITTLTTTEDFRRKPQHRCWCLAKNESMLADCTLV